MPCHPRLFHPRAYVVKPKMQRNTQCDRRHAQRVAVSKVNTPRRLGPQPALPI